MQPDNLSESATVVSEHTTANTHYVNVAFTDADDVSYIIGRFQGANYNVAGVAFDDNEILFIK